SWRTPTGSSTSAPAPAATAGGSSSRAPPPTPSPTARPSPASTSRTTSAPDPPDPAQDPMDITIHPSFLPQDDPDAALAFHAHTPGFEVGNDVGYKGMRWITVGPPGQPATSIVLHPPGADPGVTDDERRTITEMMAKGTYAVILLATADLD